MKYIKKNFDGYIMIFTLIAVGAAMMVVTYVGYRGSFYLPFSTMILAREQAKAITLAGVQIAIAQLSQEDKKENNTKSGDVAGAGKESSSEEQDFLLRILPTLNRWQQFDLIQDIDGIDGQIKVCLMCEEGKINLNKIIDFKKGELKGSGESSWKIIIQEICKSIEKRVKGVDLFPVFEKIIKDATFKFNDATELIARKEFSPFKDVLFYEPATTKKQDTLFLMDIFTVWSSSDKIEPWLFSDSMNGLLGLPRVEVDDIKKRKEQVATWVKNFKPQADWQKDWDKMLMPVYGKGLQALPLKIASLLSTQFKPRFFSVLVHGKVGEVTQRMYAILERNKLSQENANGYNVTIKKLYWL